MCSRYCSCSDPPRHHVNTQIASLGRELHWSGPGVDSAACDDRIPLGSRSNYKVEKYEQQMRFASPVAATALPRHAEGPHPASALFSPKETYDNIVAAGTLEWTYISIVWLSFSVEFKRIALSVGTRC